jgi:hypothetical protein
MALLDDLVSLNAQATTERTHHYVGDMTARAIGEIENLRAVIRSIADPGPDIIKSVMKLSGSSEAAKTAARLLSNDAAYLKEVAQAAIKEFQ